MASSEETKQIAHKIDDAHTKDVRFQEGVTFNSMMLTEPVRRGLAKAGYLRPTYMQSAAIPVGKVGLDMLVQSKAGIGKTLIFATVVVEAYRPDALRPQSLIVVPTRELAIQIADVLKQISCFCPGFKTIVTVGGTDEKDDRMKLKNAVAVVGTPGRLNALIRNRTLNTSNIKILVLDECDHLLRGGFTSELHKIIRSLQVERQTIACSATMNSTVTERLVGLMRSPASISSKGCDFALVGIKQFVYEMSVEHNSIVEMNLKVKAVVDILHRIKYKQTALFANSRMRAENYAISLEKGLNLRCAVMSAALDQKSREKLFKEIRKGEVSLFVSTDLMARGFDSEYLDLVINLDMPSDKTQYLHRMGRAGRFGTYGILITFIHGENERVQFSNIVSQLGAKVLIFPKETTPGEDLLDFDDIDSQCEKYGIFEPNDSLSTLVCQEQNIENTCADSKTYKITSNGDEEKEVQDVDFPASHQDSSLPLSNTIDDASSIAADSEHSSSLEASKSVNYRNMLDLVMGEDSDEDEADYFDAFEKYKKMCDSDPNELRQANEDNANSDSSSSNVATKHFPSPAQSHTAAGLPDAVHLPTVLRKLQTDEPGRVTLSDSSDSHCEPKNYIEESAGDSEVADVEEKSSYDEIEGDDEQEDTTVSCDTDKGYVDVESCATTTTATDSPKCSIDDEEEQPLRNIVCGIPAEILSTANTEGLKSFTSIAAEGRDEESNIAAAAAIDDKQPKGSAAKLTTFQRRWNLIYHHQVNYIETTARISAECMRQVDEKLQTG